MLKDKRMATCLMAAVTLLAAHLLTTDVRATGSQAPKATQNGFSGTWESDDPQHRFRLKIAGASVEWTERATGMPDFVRKVPLQIDKSGQATISRPNDEACLTFLGFQPTLRAAIVAHGPKPSFMTLSRDGAELVGLWNGLLAIKDAKGQFQSLKQPGETPAKRFVFKPAS